MKTVYLMGGLGNILFQVSIKGEEKNNYNHSIEDYIRNIRKMINK
jgi:hypothetical protein